MSKIINIPGRIHSTEKGNVSVGANEVLDDTKGKKQNVINSETDAELLRLSNEKQDNLTFDNAPTENSNNPVKSSGVYAADKALSDAIEAILLLIPSAATELNKLVDLATMNSSISTATATFRGTYNAVTDLHLTYQATHEQIAAALDALNLPADNNDYAFVQVPTSDSSTEIRRTERYKHNGTNWGYEYDLNTSGFTAVQWASINSGITALLVAKLGALPTADELAVLLGQKQDNLTFDTVPTALSNNPVTSGGVYTAILAVSSALSTYQALIDPKIAAIEGKIPSGASSSNQLTAKDYVDGIKNTLQGYIDAINGKIPADAATNNKLTDKNYVDTLIAAIAAKIPDAASGENKLVDTAAMMTYVADIINTIDASFNVTSTDGHITLHITQVDGVITSVQVQGSDIASAADLALKASQADLTTLTGRVSTAENDIATLQQLYNNLQQSKPVPVTTLPTSGQQQGVIYRLAGTTSYSDYMWNGSSWVLMATYNNAIDDVPTYQSNNLVKSGGVEATRVKKILTDNLINPEHLRWGKFIGGNGIIQNGTASYCVSEEILVNGQNMICNGISASYARAWVVYNSVGTMLRYAAENQRQYTYQEGDYKIVFGFSGSPETSINLRANVGTVLINVPYSEYAPVIELEAKVNNKVEKEFVNLINPSKVTPNSYISGNGIISTTELSSYSVSDYIAVNGQDIISNAVSTSSVIRSWIVYDENYTRLRWAGEDVIQYTYQPGDAYLRIGFNTENRFANYGTTLIKAKYTDYAPVALLQLEIDNLKEDTPSPIKADDVAYSPNVLYKVWNDIDATRQYSLKLGLSRMLSVNKFFNKEKYLGNGLRFLPIVPEQVSSKTLTQLSIVGQEKTVNIRNTPASASQNVKPRVLIIGDSVTSGYGADSNKESSLPVQYFAYAKMFFEMDKIDNGDSGHDILFVGGVITNGDFNIDYKSVSRQVRAKAEGKGGAALQDLFTATWGDSQSVNPFYDSANDTFSILSYLANYRTMDNLGVRLPSNSADPHGESVVGSDGQTYTIGNRITSQQLLSSIDVCTPTHIFINMNHNTSTANFQSNIANVVNIIKTELPSVTFAWLCIDSTGTNFPKDYPDFEQSMIAMTSLHTQNLTHFNYFKNNIEDESEDIYLLGMNFIQPEAIDRPYTEISYPNKNIPSYKIADLSIAGAAYHPNNIAHAEWGYELYSFIKWLI